MEDQGVKAVENTVVNIATGKDVVTIQCADGREFSLTVGECLNLVNIHLTAGEECVVEEGVHCTFRLSSLTATRLKQWANEWPG